MQRRFFACSTSLRKRTGSDLNGFRNYCCDLFRLRQISGLTWNEIAVLFGVERRTVHLWVSGKSMDASHADRLIRILDVVVKADRGSSSLNREFIFQEKDGVVPFDLLADGDYDRFLCVVGIGHGRKEIELRPLSKEEQELRKPPLPEMLVGALHDRVHVDSS